ncbi:hypothetical protein LCGC14_2624620 [marine sediment metagenome]|uniref:Uncharacterized protein n=1 Tax=marine sediment metagenome TaxID=412755 RepID=A0A0F9CUJ5_9ZZZZ
MSILLLYIGCVIPDLQGVYSIFIDRSVALHGFSHTLVGALVYTLIMWGALFLIKYTPSTEYLEFQPAKHFILLLLAIVIFHFLPDIFIWADMNIFWPFGSYSPGEVENYGVVAQVLFLSGVTGVGVWGIGYLK